MKIAYKSVVYDLNEDQGKPAYFAFGIRKSGSSLLNQMLQAMAKMNGVKFVDVAGALFLNGHLVREWQQDQSLADIIHPGNLYGGFRQLPLGILDDPRFRDSKKVLLVRDPRDALVSEYFSNAYSHQIPVQGASRQDMLERRKDALGSNLVDYVLKMAPAMRRTHSEYAKIVQDPNLLVLKYENVIMQKTALIENICQFFGWTMTDAQIANVLKWADIVPDQERPTEFVRKVVPGDHIEKLPSEVIAQLNAILEDSLRMHDYKI